MRRLLLLPLVASLAACAAAEGGAPSAGSHTDAGGAGAGGAPSDAGVDAPDSSAEAGVDAPVDAIDDAAEASADSSQDAPADASPDAPADASQDAPADASQDAPADASQDAPADASQDAPADASTDSIADAPVDVAADAPSTPVDIGAYTYTIVPTYSLVNPPAVAWHPTKPYALVLNGTDAVYSYDPATHALTKVASAGTSVGWRAVAFTPDGTKAVLLGNVASPAEGRVYVWDDATSTLAQMTSATFGGGSLEAIAWSPDGTAARLLGQKPNTGGTYLAYVWAFDASSGVSGLKVRATSAGCQDLAWATDQFGAPAVAVVCGVNGVSLFHIDGGGNFVDYTGNAGNTSRIAARPQGDYALAIGWSGQRVYRFEQGNWTTSFYSPTFPGIFQVAFSTDGRRALLLGGAGGSPTVGQVYEFRHDLMQQSDFTNVSIPGFSSPPYNADTYVNLNDAAWRPGCDGGLIVAGSNTYSSQKGYLVRFDVANGVACPN